MQLKANKLNVMMVLDGYYPSDIRVRKEAEALSKVYNVYVLCSRNKGEKVAENINNIEVRRNVNYKSKYSKGFSDIILALTFSHLKFRAELSKLCKELKIDILHVHDLPLANTVLNISRKIGAKSVLDLHENYPAALSTWFGWRRSKIIQIKNRIFFNYQRWELYESKMIKKYDKVIAVVEEMKDFLTKKYNLSKDHIGVVTNTEEKKFSYHFLNEKKSENEEEKFVISYVGGFGPHRGIHTAINAIPIIKRKIPNVLLQLVGPKNKDVEYYLSKLINDNALEEHVIMKEKVPFVEVLKIMKSSKLNIIPHVSNEHTEHTIPHKLFQILLSQSPILVSSCKPLKRIIDTNEIGYCFEAGNSMSFAEEVVYIYDNYEVALEKSRKGYEMAFHGELNWEHTSKELLKLYANL